MKNKLISVILITLSLTLASCTSNAGSDFLGKWQNIKVKNDQLEIVKNGEDSLVMRTSLSLMTMTTQTEKLPMQLKNRVLKMDAGILSASISYIEATDTLSATGFRSMTQEYRRIK